MAGLFRFNQFTLDASAYQLSRGKRIVKIERLPMELLMLLVERRGELVTREQIAERLWGEGVFVDVENGINTAIRKLRRALGDDSGQPRYIETVAARGYRFMPEISAPDARATHAVMLAVLPFLDLSRDASQEYFADGERGFDFALGAKRGRRKRRQLLSIASYRDRPMPKTG